MRLEFVGRGEDETALRIDITVIREIEFFIKKVDASQADCRLIHLPANRSINYKNIIVIINSIC